MRYTGQKKKITEGKFGAMHLKYSWKKNCYSSHRHFASGRIRATRVRIYEPKRLNKARMAKAEIKRQQIETSTKES